jgi:hypothetical protein
MISGRQSGLPRAFIVAALFCVGGGAHAAGYETIFNGRVSEGRIWAIRLHSETDLDSLDDIALASGTTLIVYGNDFDVSSAEPLAIRVSDGTKIRFEDPRVSTDGTLISDYVKAANIAGGKKLEATCGDGSNARISGEYQLARMMKAWEKCQGHGGVERIYYKTFKDTHAVVASICEDFRLVAGDGEQCGGRAGVLVRIRNRDY